MIQWRHKANSMIQWQTSAELILSSFVNSNKIEWYFHIFDTFLILCYTHYYLTNMIFFLEYNLLYFTSF